VFHAHKTNLPRLRSSDPDLHRAKASPAVHYSPPTRTIGARLLALWPLFGDDGFHGPLGFWSEWTQTAQQSARDAQRAAWDAQKTGAEATARVIETTAPTNGSLPIAGYDEKSVEEISARLDTLTVDQLERLKDYERRNKNRETLIREIDRRIGAAS
jgi:hypothetical protein